MLSKCQSFIHFPEKFPGNRKSKNSKMGEFSEGYRATFNRIQSDNRAPIGFIYSCSKFSIEARLTRLKPIGSRLSTPQSLNNPVQSSKIRYNHAPILDCTFLPLIVARLDAFYNQTSIIDQSTVIVYYPTNHYDLVPIHRKSNT